MRFVDVAYFALQTLWQQKVRAILNLTGVVIGAFILLFTFAAGTGIEHTVVRLLRQEDYLRSIIVSPSYDFEGESVPEELLVVNESLDEEKKARIRERLIRRWRQKNDYRSLQPITLAKVEAMKRIAHVESVTPQVRANCTLTFEGRDLTSELHGIRALDREIDSRIVAGRNINSWDGDELLLNEFLAYEWGFETAEQLEELIGRTVAVQFRLRNTQLDYMLQFAAERRQRMSQENEGGATSTDDQHSTHRVADGDTAEDADDPISFEERSRLIEQLAELPELMEQSGIDKEMVELIQMMLRDPFEEQRRSAEMSADAPAPESIRKQMTIVGIVRDRNPGEQRVGFGMWMFLRGEPDVMVPVDVAAKVAVQMPDHEVQGFEGVTVVVSDESQVEEVAAEIEALGLQQNSLLQFIEFLREQIAVGKFIMACIAAVIFLVSGLGIANTMIMSVMERTYEIGVMKAVGARNRHILGIFLGEGCLIGVLGSLVAVAAAVILAKFLDGVAQQRLSNRLGLEIEPPIFIFSSQLILMVFLFSTLVTLVATAIPAWRAARIDPIAALRSR